MTRFIHRSVRLYTHLTRAYRLFTYPKEIVKWLDDNFNVEVKESGPFEFLFSLEGCTSNTKGSIILEWEREKFLKIFWKDDRYFSEGTIVEFNYMSSTSETEYCSEIHVVHKGFENLPADAVKFYAEFWEELLEKARKRINGDWIIKDEELNLDCLK